VAVGERVAAPFWADADAQILRHGMTYSGHAAACAAAMVNLDIIEREQLRAQAERLSVVLHEEVQSLRDRPMVTEVRSGLGLMAGVQLADPVAAERASRILLDRGQIVRAITNGTLQFSPPFVASETDLRECVSQVREVIAEVESQHDIAPVGNKKGQS
jgi:adenosylmethionine-8-amino-7-oxononanoate aminotransferase